MINNVSLGREGLVVIPADTHLFMGTLHTAISCIKYYNGTFFGDSLNQEVTLKRMYFQVTTIHLLTNIDSGLCRYNVKIVI